MVHKNQLDLAYW